MSTQTSRRWFDEVRSLTERLVRIDSVSPSLEGENACAAEIGRILAEQGLTPGYWQVQDGRKIVWAMLEGGTLPAGATRIPTVVLIGHLDTGDVQDYGPDADPFDPRSLRESLLARYRDNPATHDEILRDAASGDWMFGRGSFDMKSGIAAQAAVMGALFKVRDSLPGNVLMIATPDEEVESAGIMAAVGEMVRLRDAHDLAYVGVINSDYTAPREPGDEARYIYRGTIGKMLACFYVRGCETHLGEVFRGLDANLIAANLIRETNLNVDLCDEAEGEITVPPVTQKLRDFKVRYDAQIPMAALVHCSVLVHGRTPADVLSRMVAAAGRALSLANHRRVTQWSEYARRQNRALALEDLGGRVWTYGQLFEATAAQVGPDLKRQIEARAFEALRQARRSLAPLAPAEKKVLIDRGILVLEDSRERSLALVRALVEIAGQNRVMDLRKPSVVVYFAPPFFPPVSGNRPSRLNRAIAAEVETGAYGAIQFRSFYPYVSDISYMRVDEPVYESLPLLKRNFPLWRDEDEVTDKDLSGEFFNVPFDLIRELDCDVANIGPWGKEAHGKGERVHMPYSFETVPELIHNVILRLLGDVA